MALVKGERRQRPKKKYTRCQRLAYFSKRALIGKLDIFFKDRSRRETGNGKKGDNDESE